MKNYYTEDEIEEGQRLRNEALAKLSSKYPFINKKQDHAEIVKSPIEEIRGFVASFSKKVIFEELQGKVFITVEAIQPHRVYSVWVNNDDDFCGQLIKFSINKNEFYLLKISDGYSFLDFYSIPDESLKKIEELTAEYKLSMI